MNCLALDDLRDEQYPAGASMPLHECESSKPPFPAEPNVIAPGLAFAACAIQPYKAGRIKILGVSTAKRVPQIPEVATIGETLPGYEAHTWFGVLVPAGTPQPIVDRLSRESMKILQSEEIRRRFADVGAEPVGGTPQQFAAFMAAETIKWAKVIKASGARID